MSECSHCEGACPVGAGFCHCDCGEKTNITKYTSRREGYTKGVPRKFRHGHGARKTPRPNHFQCACMSKDCAVPWGTCHCGCGGTTTVSDFTSARAGHYKGHPYQFLHGHGNFGTDWTGIRIGKATAVKKDRKVGKTTMWLFRCDCGAEFSAGPKSLTKKKNEAACVDCYVVPDRSRGSAARNWKGVGNLSHSFYRSYFNSAKQRGTTFNVTIEYLWELFESQRGECALSGISLRLGTSRGRMTTASLDRIDNDVGYEPGNVQWVHKDLNFMKAAHTQERFVELCTAVAHFQNGELK